MHQTNVLSLERPLDSFRGNVYEGNAIKRIIPDESLRTRLTAEGITVELTSNTVDVAVWVLVLNRVPSILTSLFTIVELSALKVLRMRIQPTWFVLATLDQDQVRSMQLKYEIPVVLSLEY